MDKKSLAGVINVLKTKEDGKPEILEVFPLKDGQNVLARMNLDIQEGRQFYTFNAWKWTIFMRLCL